MGEYGRSLNLSEYCAVDVSQPRNDSTDIDCMKFIPDYMEIDEEFEDSDESCCTSESADDIAMYGLKSVVHHIGSSTTFGHYTADILSRKFSDKQNDSVKWLRCNDANITTYDENDLSKIGDSRKTAYMVMYELEQ